MGFAADVNRRAAIKLAFSLESQPIADFIEKAYDFNSPDKGIADRLADIGDAIDTRATEFSPIYNTIERAHDFTPESNANIVDNAMNIIERADEHSSPAALLLHESQSSGVFPERVSDKIYDRVVSRANADATNLNTAMRSVANMGRQGVTSLDAPGVLKSNVRGWVAPAVARAIDSSLSEDPPKGADLVGVNIGNPFNATGDFLNFIKILKPDKSNMVNRAVAGSVLLHEASESPERKAQFDELRRILSVKDPEEKYRRLAAFSDKTEDFHPPDGSAIRSMHGGPAPIISEINAAADATRLADKIHGPSAPDLSDWLPTGRVESREAAAIEDAINDIIRARAPNADLPDWKYGKDRLPRNISEEELSTALRANYRTGRGMPASSTNSDIKAKLESLDSLRANQPRPRA